MEEKEEKSVSNKKPSPNSFESTVVHLMNERELTERINIDSESEYAKLDLDKKYQTVVSDKYLDTLNPLEVDEVLVQIFNIAERLIVLHLEPARRPVQWWMDKFQFLRERHDQEELNIFVVFDAKPNELKMITLPNDYHQKKKQQEERLKGKRVPFVSWRDNNKPKPRM